MSIVSRAFLARTAAAVLLSTAIALPALAGFTVTGTPKVVFYAVGSPSFLDIEGATSSMTVADDATTLTFTVPMGTVKTGIDLRDNHMNEHYVEVGKFPNAILSLARADVKWPAALGEATEGEVKGSFNAHGVATDVSVSYNVKKTKTGFRVTAKFPFDISKHGIAVPSYLGITVDSAMRAQVTVDLAGS